MPRGKGANDIRQRDYRMNMSPSSDLVRCLTGSVPSCTEDVDPQHVLYLKMYVGIV